MVNASQNLTVFKYQNAMVKEKFLLETSVAVTMALKDTQLVTVMKYLHVLTMKFILISNAVARTAIGLMELDASISNVVNSNSSMVAAISANLSVAKNQLSVQPFAVNQLVIVLMDIFVIPTVNAFQKMSVIFPSRVRIMRSKLIMFAFVKVT